MLQTTNKKLDFSGENIYAGFDVHKKSWRVTIMTDRLTHKTFVQPPSPQVLVNYLEHNFPSGSYHSAYEAGFCGFWIHQELKKLGVNSIVVNPADIPTSQKEFVQKEDRRDSAKIARGLKNGDLRAIYVPNQKTLEDRSLMRTRHAMVKDLVRYKLRIKSFLYFYGIEIPAPYTKTEGYWSKGFSNWLKGVELTQPTGKLTLGMLVRESESLRASILETTRYIQELSRSGEYQEKVALLRTIPGIGLIVSMTLLTELEDIKRFPTTDDLCSFIGFVPKMHNSGDQENYGDLTFRASEYLRKLLIESAWVAARRDPALMKAYHDYCKRMHPNKAIVRIARKLVNRIKYVLRTNQPYVSLKID